MIDIPDKAQSLIQSIKRSDIRYEGVYYISGPMTGYPKYNYPAFQFAYDVLTAAGVKVLSPHQALPPSEADRAAMQKTPDPEAALWSYYMTCAMEMMEQCDGIIMLRGWPQSKGAVTELRVALTDGNWDVFYFDQKSATFVSMNKE